MIGKPYALEGSTPPAVVSEISGETDANPTPTIVSAEAYVDSLYDVVALNAQVVIAVEVTSGVWRPWHTIIDASVGGLWVPGGARHQITITGNSGTVTVVGFHGKSGFTADDSAKLAQMEVTTNGINFTGDVTADGTIS